jgi:hypothetical protein
MKFHSLLLLLVATALPIIASDEESSLKEAIQPRTAEGKWEFTSVYFEDGTMIPGGTTTEKVMEFRDLEGERIYRIQLLNDWRTLAERLTGQPIDPDSISYFWEYFNEDGSYNFSEDFDSPAPPESLSDFSLTLPYPVEKNYGYEADGVDWKVVEVDREITVPSGTFATVVYELSDVYEDDPENSTRERYYMAPGVGLVRWEMDLKGESGEWVLDMRDDLFSYNL